MASYTGPVGAPSGGKAPSGGPQRATGAGVQAGAMQQPGMQSGAISPFALSAMGGMPGKPKGGPLSGGYQSGNPDPGFAGGGGVNPNRAVPGHPGQVFWGSGGPLASPAYEPGNPDPGFASGGNVAARDFMARLSPVEQQAMADAARRKAASDANPGFAVGGNMAPDQMFWSGGSTPGVSVPAGPPAGGPVLGGVPGGQFGKPTMGVGGNPLSPAGTGSRVGEGIQTPQPNDPFAGPTSAMDVYRSSVPVMQDAMKTAVGGAMADAGFSGNRFGSYAMDRAAQEGSRAGLQQNQLLSDLLYRQTNADQDRALQAAGLASQHGQAEDRMQLDRMRQLAELGMWEQGRQDQFSRLPYEDFQRNMLGFLPMLAQMAQAPGTATQGVWGQNQTGGSPGFIDYAAALAPLLAAFAASDERLKDGIRPLGSLDKVERLQPRAWEWKGTGITDTGFVAQEVREVAPELVRPITPDGILGISIPGMVALSVSAIQKLSQRVRELEAT